MSYYLIILIQVRIRVLECRMMIACICRSLMWRAGTRVTERHCWRMARYSYKCELSYIQVWQICIIHDHRNKYKLTVVNALSYEYTDCKYSVLTRVSPKVTYLPPYEYIHIHIYIYYIHHTLCRIIDFLSVFYDVIPFRKNIIVKRNQTPL